MKKKTYLDRIIASVFKTTAIKHSGYYHYNNKQRKEQRDVIVSKTQYGHGDVGILESKTNSYVEALST